MRLTEVEQNAIKETFLEVYGRGKIYLFGSRIDDAKKGGDIDLYLDAAAQDRVELFMKKPSFLAKLKRKIGDRKIDLVVAAKEQREIDKEAIETGVLLCQK